MQKDTQLPVKPTVNFKDTQSNYVDFDLAFSIACDKKCRFQKGYFRANFETIDQALLANLHHFIDTYKPSEFILKRSGYGIVVLTCK